MFNATTGTYRDFLTSEDVQALSGTGALSVDPRRTRPLWFDGRFLTARDLNREQAYVLTRQADLAAGLGTGVIGGLEVSPVIDQATSLRIGAGTGVASGGSTVVLAEDVQIDLADLPKVQGVNRSLGFDQSAGMPDQARSGLFIVALRPVAFTADPIGAYPSELGEERVVEDSEIVDASLVTLVPYRDRPMDAGSSDRSWVATQIFREGQLPEMPPGVLPLAIIALERNQIRWIDPWLIRRQAEALDSFSLGAPAKSERRALLGHYHDVLGALLANRRRADASRFAAGQYFHVLPPVGQMPLGGVSVDQSNQMLVQHYFPAEVAMEVSLAPQDELEAIVEDALSLPPIDLDADPDVFASMSILVLVPVPRQDLRSLERELGGISTSLTAVGSRRVQADLLVQLRATLSRRRRRLGQLDDAEAPPPTAFAAWQRLIEGAGELWFVRRRSFNQSSPVIGSSIVVQPSDPVDDALTTRLGEWSLTSLHRRVTDDLDDRLAVTLADALAAPAFANSELMTRSVLVELSESAVNAARLRTVITRFRGTAPVLSELAGDASPKAQRNLADTGQLPELAALALDADERFRRQVRAVVQEALERETNTAGLQEVIKKLEEQRDVRNDPQPTRPDPVDASISARLRPFGQDRAYKGLVEAVGADGADLINDVLRQGSMRSLPVLSVAYLVDIAAKRPRDAEQAKALSTRYRVPTLGTGLRFLPDELLTEKKPVEVLAKTLKVPELDAAIPRLSSADRASAIENIVELTKQGDSDKLGQLIDKVQELARRGTNRPTGGGTDRPAPARPAQPTRPSRPVLTPVTGVLRPDLVVTPVGGGTVVTPTPVRTGTVVTPVRPTRTGTTVRPVVSPAVLSSVVTGAARVRASSTAEAGKAAISRLRLTASVTRSERRWPAGTRKTVESIAGRAGIVDSDLAVRAVVVEAAALRTTAQVNAFKARWSKRGRGKGLKSLQSTLGSGSDAAVKKRQATLAKIKLVPELDDRAAGLRGAALRSFSQQLIRLLDGRGSTAQLKALITNQGSR